MKMYRQHPFLALIAASSILVFGAGAVEAQQDIGPAQRPNGIACKYNLSEPTVQDGQVVWVQCDATGHPIVTVAPGGFAPYSYTHLGGRQLALSISSVQSLTPPQGAVYASVQANGGTAFYSLVGVNPGLADGSNQLSPGQPALWLSGADIIANFRALGGAGVTLTVEYFK